MDANRARSILNSPDSIQVMHEDTPVWIERVVDNHAAEIRFLNNNKREIIPLNQLIENKM